MAKQTVRDVMTGDPITVDAGSTIVEAATKMRDADIGAVVVNDGEKICGLLTDRDIVVRAVADGREPGAVKVRDVCSSDLTTLSPSDSVDHAVKVMRERAVRRLPVVENNHAVGILSIGDLAIERDPKSALADISAAPPND